MSEKKQELTTEQQRIVDDLEAEAKASRTVETPKGRTKTTEVEGKVEVDDSEAEEKFTKSIKG